MKKRSLFAAVAMLIVSAILMTSATYAWFSGTTTVSVPEISATVSGSDGSLLLSGDGGSTWKTTLLKADLTSLAEPNNGELTPISVTPDAADLKAMSGSLTGTAFTSGDVTSSFGSYAIKYSYMIKATVDCTVNVTPAFQTQADFGYAFVAVDNGVASGTDAYSATKLLGTAANRSYNSIAYSSTAVSETDSNGNAIIDDHDSSYTTGDIVSCGPTVASGVAFPVTAKANTPITVSVWMWAEGNDTACKGTISDAALTMNFTVAKGS